MKRRADQRPFEQRIHAIVRHSLGLGVVATLALCMLALALADVPGGRP